MVGWMAGEQSDEPIPLLRVRDAIRHGLSPKTLARWLREGRTPYLLPTDRRGDDGPDDGEALPMEPPEP